MLERKISRKEIKRKFRFLANKWSWINCNWVCLNKKGITIKSGSRIDKIKRRALHSSWELDNDHWK